MRAFGALLIFLFVVFLPERAHAYPWMIRHGYGGCTTCHVDPSGGELLTRYGRIQGDLLLRMRYGKDTVSAAASEGGSNSNFDSFDSFDSSSDRKPRAAGNTATTAEAAPASSADQGGEAKSAGFLWGLFDLPDWLLLGGAYRHMTVYKPSEKDISTFPMQIDVYGAVQFGRFHASGSVGFTEVDAGSVHGHAAQITTAQGKQLNVVSRTHWLGFDITPNVMLRAGRLNLPFGLRIPEHTMWVRDATRTDRESDQEHGVALAFQGDWFRGEVMGIAGNYQINPDRFRERGYSGYFEALAADWAAVGVSSLVTHAKEDWRLVDGKSMVRQAHGAFARLAVTQKAALLLEADGLLRSRSSAGYTGMAQADYEIVQGLHLMLTGEVLDQGKMNDVAASQKGAGKPAFGSWQTIDWFFLPHFEARIDALERQNDPFTLLGQLHFYL